VEVAGTFVGVGIAIVVTAGLDEDAVVVVAAVLVAIVGVLVPVTSGVLEAAVAIKTVDVEATRSRDGVVVASNEEGGEDVALT
jgi:hypothetical protein